MSEICTLLKLVLVVPATNAVSERSASALCRVKSKFTIDNVPESSKQLDGIHVHKQMTDKLKACVNEFVS